MLGIHLGFVVVVDRDRPHGPRRGDPLRLSGQLGLEPVVLGLQLVLALRGAGCLLLVPPAAAATPALPIPLGRRRPAGVEAFKLLPHRLELPRDVLALVGLGPARGAAILPPPGASTTLAPGHGWRRRHDDAAKGPALVDLALRALLARPGVPPSTLRALTSKAAKPPRLVGLLGALPGHGRCRGRGRRVLGGSHLPAVGHRGSLEPRRP